MFNLCGIFCNKVVRTVKISQKLSYSCRMSLVAYALQHIVFNRTSEPTMLSPGPSHQCAQHPFLHPHRSTVLKETSFAVSFLTFFPPLSLFFQTLTGAADFGSLLFSLNPLPDFSPSQIYKDFRNKLQADMNTSPA